MLVNLLGQQRKELGMLDLLLVILYLSPGALALMGALFFKHLPDRNLILERLKEDRLVRQRRSYQPYDGFEIKGIRPKYWLVGKQITVGYWKKIKRGVLLEKLMVICPDKAIHSELFYKNGAIQAFRVLVKDKHLSRRTKDVKKVFSSILEIVREKDV